MHDRDCAINCGLELQTKGTRPFTGIIWLGLGSGSGLALGLGLGRELQTKDKTENKCCCRRKKRYTKHSPSGKTIPRSVTVRVRVRVGARLRLRLRVSVSGRARAANEGESPKQMLLQSYRLQFFQKVLLKCCARIKSRQDAHPRVPAENVSCVHTCLHVCVGTGNLVMCMTEDCAINCGLEL